MSEPLREVNEDSLPSLLKESAPRLRDFIGSRFPMRLKSLVSVEDILQEVWIDAFRCLPNVRLDGPLALDRWLMTLARRKVINKIAEFQRVKRDGARTLRQYYRGKASSFVDLFLKVVSTDRTPSSAAAISEAATAIKIALAGLSENHRQAIHLRFIEGHCPEEVARIMNRPLTVVRGMIFRGLRKLQAELGEASKFWSDIPAELQDEIAS